MKDALVVLVLFRIHNDFYSVDAKASKSHK